jgi:hypothetical protein
MSLLGKRNYKRAFGYDNDYEYYQEQKIEKIIEGKIPFNEDHAKTEKGKKEILQWMQVYKAHISTKYSIPISEL